MDRQQVLELYYLTPMANLASIAEHGILSHNKVRNLRHRSIAMQEIQDRRERVVVPNGRRLHEYANLYFCVRNPMMYKRLDQREELCVLRVCHHVLDLPNVVITDGNAAGSVTKFQPSPTGVAIVDAALTHARYWNLGDEIEQNRRRLAKCAEVLVPDRIAVKFILGVRVCSSDAQATYAAYNMPFPVAIATELFFQ